MGIGSTGEGRRGGDNDPIAEEARPEKLGLDHGSAPTPGWNPLNFLF